LVFVDLRDETCVTQLVLNPEHAPQTTEVAHGVRNEFVLQARGTVVRRSLETVKPKMATGEVEVQVEELTVLSASTPLPFRLDVEPACTVRELSVARMQRIVARIWGERIDVDLNAPFQRMTCGEAMLRFAIDRPDVRLGMEIQGVTADTRESEFGVFSNAPCV